MPDTRSEPGLLMKMFATEIGTMPSMTGSDTSVVTVSPATVSGSSYSTVTNWDTESYSPINST